MKSEAANAKASYHHGDLRQALMSAGEQILSERGVDGFSLREAARRAGVSSAAPAHHFGDARGLLTAIATHAFVDFRQALVDANQHSGTDRDARLRAQGRAYVRYALSHPERFDLMWRHEILNKEDPAYCAAGLAAFSVLYELVTGEPVTAQMLDTGAAPNVDPRVIASWSMVHGFANLARAGSFDAETPGLLDGVLACLRI